MLILKEEGEQQVYPQACIEALELIYKKLHEQLKSLPCPCDACGACCQFSNAEHRLYISELELTYVLKKYEIPKIEGDVCPFMVDEKCTVRDRRMLGCRSYFRAHSQEDHVRAEALYEKALKEIKALYSQYNLKWVYKDLMVFLKEVEEA